MLLVIYASQTSLADNIKKQFWGHLDVIVQDVPHGKKFFLWSDLNKHIGTKVDGYDSSHGVSVIGKETT